MGAGVGGLCHKMSPAGLFLFSAVPGSCLSYRQTSRALPSSIGYPPNAVGYPPTAVRCPPTCAGHLPTGIGSPPNGVLRLADANSFFSLMDRPE